MKYLPKILLAISVAMFAVSLTPGGSNIYYGILKPLSAILFIAFFILRVTQREVAWFDEDEAQRHWRRSTLQETPSTYPIAAARNATLKSCLLLNAINS